MTPSAPGEAPHSLWVLFEAAARRWPDDPMLVSPKATTARSVSSTNVPYEARTRHLITPDRIANFDFAEMGRRPSAERDIDHLVVHPGLFPLGDPATLAPFVSAPTRVTQWICYTSGTRNRSPVRDPVDRLHPSTRRIRRPASDGRIPGLRTLHSRRHRNPVLQHVQRARSTSGSQMSSEHRSCPHGD